MSILRTHNLQNPDSSSINIVMDQGGNTNITGVTTVGSNLKVGIGEDSPVSRLHLANSGSGNVSMTITNDTTGHTSGNGVEIGMGGDEQAQIWNYENSYFRVGTNNQEKLRITSEGNVIIAESMAVNRPRIVLSAPNDGTNYRHLFGANLQVNSSGTFTTPTANISGGGWEYLPANSLNDHGNLRYLSAPDTNSTSSTPVERLRIDSAGRMGLGVVPSNFGTNRTALEIHSPSSTVTHLALTNSTTGSNGASNGFNIIQNGNNALLYLRENANMTFSTNNVERIHIASNGQVLVGNYATHSAIHGNLEVNGNDGINISNATRTGTNGVQWRLIPHNGGGSATNLRLYEGTGATEVINITKTGLVQIGTTQTSNFPDRLLSVGDHTRTSSYIDIRSGTVGALLFADGLSGNTAYRGQVEYTHSDDRMCFWTAGGERVRITSSGNMGLGTGSPVAKLDVRGNVYVGDSIGVDITNPQDYHASANDIVVKNGMTIANTSQGSIFFADSSTGTGEYVGQINYYHNNNQLSFVTNNTERMRLSGNGEHMVYSNGTVSALRTAASSSGSSEILYCSRNSSSVTVGTGVYAIYSNGTASSLSDRTQKKNIETTRDGYLEDLNRLRVVKYNWNDQEDGTPKELGLIAQEVEEVFPGLISNMRSDVGIGTTASTKGVKTSVLPYMLLKALQEANAEIVALKARVNTLEGS